MIKHLIGLAKTKNRENEIITNLSNSSRQTEVALGGAVMIDGATKFSSGHGAKDAVLMLMMQNEDTIW